MFLSVWREFRLVGVEDRGALSKYNLVESTKVFLCARGLRRIQFGGPPLVFERFEKPIIVLARDARLLLDS